ncbi:MAG TPA: cell division protein FtsZ, partial [Verrucomicrobiae bacterium]|nr:cell division protein FtsZ [Verrucomicrobiae bacterium]
SQGLANFAVAERFELGTQVARGMGAGGDPEAARTAADADYDRIKELCAGVDLVFIVAGLGRGTGTGASPVVARAAKDAGALVLALVALPFNCEGPRLMRQATSGVQALKSAADAVICLPNHKIERLIDRNRPLRESFAVSNDWLAQGLRGIWRMITRPGILDVGFAHVCNVVRGRHMESVFAFAEAGGETRAREVLEKLLASPMIEEGKALKEADTILVSFVSGIDPTIAEVSDVMDQLNRQCEGADVLMGTALDETMGDRLSVTLIATRRANNAAPPSTEASEPEPAAESRRLHVDGLEMDTSFFRSAPATRTASRFVPPPPDMTPEQKQKLLAQQQRGDTARFLKVGGKWKQGLLPLEVVSKGRFEKSEPTIHLGEDLDVPTYARRGFVLN